MTVDDSQLLRSLCDRFDHAVVFEEGWPSALKLAKVFPAMRRSHGGLLLLGVRKDGTIVGVAESDITLCRKRLEHLCADLLEFTTEVGVIHVAGRNVVFVLFNRIPKHLNRLTPFESLIHERSRP